MKEKDGGDSSKLEEGLRSWWRWRKKGRSGLDVERVGGEVEKKRKNEGWLL